MWTRRFALFSNHWRSSTVIVAVIVCDFNRNVSRPANSIETVATAKISTVAPVATITAAQAATPSIVPNVIGQTISGKRSAHGTHYPAASQDQALAGAIEHHVCEAGKQGVQRNRQETVVHQQRQQRSDHEQHGGRDGRNTQITKQADDTAKQQRRNQSTDKRADGHDHNHRSGTGNAEQTGLIGIADDIRRQIPLIYGDSGCGRNGEHAGRECHRKLRRVLRRTVLRRNRLSQHPSRQVAAGPFGTAVPTA